MSYWKSYKRNDKPIWDGITVGKEYIIRDSDKNEMFKVYKTDRHFVILKGKNSRRYLNDSDHTLKHILYNQDIRTIASITKSFTEYIKTL